VTSAFLDVTRITPAGEGRWSCEVSDGWFAPTGANGGYVTALVVRAMDAAVADPDRQARSVTTHFLRPPQAGPAELHTELVRTGRTVSNVAARLVQDGKVCAQAVAAYATRQAPKLEWAPEPPAITPWDELGDWPQAAKASTIAHRFAYRGLLGDRPFSSSPEAMTGGWMALREPAPLDAALVACLTDAWLPAPFPRLDGPWPVPTIDLTVHLRADLPLDHQPVLSRFTSRHAGAGVVDEDGELWTADGTLLATSRQLSVFRA
jgi:acyl-CoA thioesterase